MATFLYGKWIHCLLLFVVVNARIGALPIHLSNTTDRDPKMSILDATLARTSGSTGSVLGIAKELSLDAAKVEKAIMVLARYAGRGDMITIAAPQTGFDTDKLAKIVTALGGEDVLGEIADELSGGLRGLGQGNFFKDLLPFG